MQVAIIDDNKEDRKDSFTFLKGFFQRTLSKDYFPLMIKEFCSGEEFLASYNPGSYQLIFLDIFMPGLNGIEVAKRIRKNHDPCKIIFLTVTEDMALEGYSVFASGYMIKPLSKHLQELQKTLAYILPQIKAERKQLFVRFNRTRISYLFSRIAYIECYGSHFVTLHVRENANSLNGTGKDFDESEPLQLTAVKTQTTFSECYRELAADVRFLECYHKLCVNMDYVYSMQEECFILKNGMTLPISRRRKTEVKLRYLTYLSKK